MIVKVLVNIFIAVVLWLCVLVLNLTVQRDFAVLRYSLLSGAAFGDSGANFERFILGGWFILKKGVGKLITKK